MKKTRQKNVRQKNEEDQPYSSLTIRREDRDRVTGARGQRQLVEVMTLIEGALFRRRVRIEVDRRSQNRLLAGREELQPTAAARRHEGFEAWRDAREAVGDD